MTKQQKFNEIYKNNYFLVYSFINKSIRSNEISEELTNDTFINASKNLETFETKKGKFSTWLVTIAKNIVIDYYRSKSNNQNLITNNISDKTDDDGNDLFELPSYETPHDMLCGKELSKQINNLSKKFDKKYRIILFLKKKGLNDKEMADILQIPINNIRVVLHRAKQQLKKELQQVQE